MKIGRVTDDTFALLLRVWREQVRAYLPQMAMILCLVVVIAATTSFYRFSNASQNRTAGVNFLSSRASVFVTTRRYVAGEVFQQAGLRVLVAAGPEVAAVVGVGEV